MNFSKELMLGSSYAELERVEGLLNQLQQALGFDDDFYARLMLSVSEAATNAVVHGNKLDLSKKVMIQAKANTTILTFTITDEGNGFDPEDIANPVDEENLLNTSGRGVFLMREYTDEIEFQDDGRKLILTFNL
jgi:serine/threonine-protein kinase RsbW